MYLFILIFVPCALIFTVYNCDFVLLLVTLESTKDKILIKRYRST